MSVSAGAIQAGEAYVKMSLEDASLRTGLRSIEGQLRVFAASVQTIGLKMLSMGSIIAAPFGYAIKAASDANETASKFGQVFGEQTKLAEEFVMRLARTVGRSTTEIREGMSSFQGMFTGMNFPRDKALSMSKTLQELAIDFASFHNTSDGRLYRSSLRGTAFFVPAPLPRAISREGSPC